MNRIALISAIFFSVLLALNGSLSTPAVFARKRYDPRLGMLAGAVTGLVGSLLVAFALLILFPDQGMMAVLGSLAGGIGGLILLWNRLPDRGTDRGLLPDGDDLKRNIIARNLRALMMRRLFLTAVVIALVSLAILLWTIANKTVGLTAVQYAVEPEDLTLGGQATGRSLDKLSEAELSEVLAGNVRSTRLRLFVLQKVVKASEDSFSSLSQQPVSQVLKGKDYPEALADILFNQLDAEQAADILTRNLSQGVLRDLIYTEVLAPEVVQGWSLWESLAKRDDIDAVLSEKYPKAHLEWKSWVSWKFITSPLDPRKPDATGLRPAVYGSLFIIFLTIVVAFPIGVGAAIYLEEYAADNRLNRIIQTNINNLAGVPSIIYGMLGLAIFVRTLEMLTSGNLFGTHMANGRTVISASFTLALLVLPLIIINAQEAIRAVPASLRQASYGLGATKWQTIWNHVLPYSMPGILTGTILAISRALGETAPLILVGGATYLTQDPKGPFSIFTAIPLLIYRWTTLPQAEFRNVAAAAIVVLMIVLLVLNSFAVVLRNRFSRRLS
jgi:phosphate transport system permease protein